MEEAYMAGTSRIAPPGAAAFLSPARAIKSCLDTVVVLEVENSEVAVERAVGRRMDPETGKIYHMQHSPPPGDAPGLLERLIPVSSQSNDTEQLQKRLQVPLRPNMHRSKCACFLHFIVCLMRSLVEGRSLRGMPDLLFMYVATKLAEMSGFEAPGIRRHTRRHGACTALPQRLMVLYMPDITVPSRWFCGCVTGPAA